jgi:hypothetical protein
MAPDWPVVTEPEPIVTSPEFINAVAADPDSMVTAPACSTAESPDAT